jgi:glyoxylate reductase
MDFAFSAASESDTATMAEQRPRVFVSRKLPAEGLARMQQCIDCSVWPDRMPPSRDELLAAVRGCDGIVSLLSDCIDVAVFDAAGPQLKVVSNFAVGVNNIDLAEAARRGIAVGNTPDVLTDATADIAVALMLAAARHLQPAFDAVRDGDWRTWEPTGWLGQDFVGRTLGIVGMGRIGAAVARRLAGGWGMNVLYTARSDKHVEGVSAAQRVSLEDLLRQSDFVSLHTDLTDQTRHMINAERLALMKPTAVLVNTSRGAVIDQDALVHALTVGTLLAAGLDVTDPEPMPPDHPLVGLSNCIILPHIGSATVASRNAMAEICIDNLLAGLAGRPLRCPVA